MSLHKDSFNTVTCESRGKKTTFCKNVENESVIINSDL